MPAFNAGATIGASIASVQCQTYENWELLVINDGSTDNTNDVIAARPDARIKVTNQDNQGVAAARNAGLRLARGKYIAFLDSDDLWWPSKLEKQVSLFERSDGDLGLVFTKHRGFTDDVSKSFGMDVDAYIGFSNDYYRLLIMDYVPTLTVMIRASLVGDIGFFREDLKGTEDWDYWIRIAKSCRLERVNEDLALYRISPNSLSRNKTKHSIEEWKVLSCHVIDSQTLPPDVINMSILFWNTKSIRHLLAAREYSKAFFRMTEMLNTRPRHFRNLCFLAYWSLRFAFGRAISRASARFRFQLR